MEGYALLLGVFLLLACVFAFVYILPNAVPRCDSKRELRRRVSKYPPDPSIASLAPVYSLGSSGYSGVPPSGSSKGAR